MKRPRPRPQTSPNTRVFPFSFVFCLFALFIIENCFSRSFLRCHRSVIVTGFKLFAFSFIPDSSLFVPHLRRLSSPQSPCRMVYTSHFILQHPHKYISIPSNSIHESHFACAAAAGAGWSDSRYLNFILMFVPSINFYNPFINLIKTKHKIVLLLIFPNSERPFARPSSSEILIVARKMLRDGI